jgi:hypothetical protein
MTEWLSRAFSSLVSLFTGIVQYEDDTEIEPMELEVRANNFNPVEQS